MLSVETFELDAHRSFPSYYRPYELVDLFDLLLLQATTKMLTPRQEDLKVISTVIVHGSV